MFNVYQQIQELLEKQNCEEALEVCENALQAHPEDITLQSYHKGITVTLDAIKKAKSTGQIDSEQSVDTNTSEEIINANSSEPLIKEMFGEIAEIEAIEANDDTKETLLQRFHEALDNDDSTEIYALAKKFGESGMQIEDDDYYFIGLVYETEVDGKISYFSVLMDKIIYISPDNYQLVVRFDDGVLPNFISDLHSNIYEECTKIIRNIGLSWQPRTEDLPKGNTRFTILTTFGNVCGMGKTDQMLDESISIAAELGKNVLELEDLILQFASGKLTYDAIQIKKLAYTTETGAKREDAIFITNRFLNKPSKHSCTTNAENNTSTADNTDDNQPDEEKECLGTEKEYRYKRLANDFTQENYRNILDSTIYILENTLTETLDAKYGKLKEQLLDIKRNIVENNHFKNYHEINAYYAIGDIDFDEYEKYDWERHKSDHIPNQDDYKSDLEKECQLRRRLNDIFAGTFLYNYLPENSADIIDNLFTTFGYESILNNLFEEQDYKTALLVASLLIDYDSQYDELHVARARIYNQLELWQEAVDDLNYAIRLNPEHYNAYYGRAINNMALKKFQDAISDLNRVINEFPEHINAYVHRGNAKNAMNDYEGAIKDYQKVLELDPENEDAKKAIENLSNLDYANNVSEKLSQIRVVNSENINAYKEIAEFAIKNPNSFPFSVLNAFIVKGINSDKNLDGENKKDLTDIILRLADAICTEGNNYYYGENYDDAKRCFDMVISAKRYANPQILIEALLRCADIYIKQNSKGISARIKDAIDISPDDERIKEFIENNVNELSFQELIDIGSKYSNKSMYQDAIDIYTYAEAAGKNDMECKRASTCIENCKKKANLM